MDLKKHRYSECLEIWKVYTFSLLGFRKCKYCSFGVFRESAQIRNSRTFVCSGIWLEVLITGTSDRRGYALRWVFVYRVGGVSQYSRGTLLVSFDALGDVEFDESISG